MVVYGLSVFLPPLDMAVGLKRHGIEAQAVVQSVKFDHYRTFMKNGLLHSVPIYAVHLRYERYEFLFMTQWDSDYRPGDKVEVLYDATNPLQYSVGSAKYFDAVSIARKTPAGRAAFLFVVISLIVIAGAITKFGSILRRSQKCRSLERLLQTLQ